MANGWDAFPEVTPADQPPRGQGRVVIPNEAGIADAGRDQTRTDIAVEADARADAAEARAAAEYERKQAQLRITGGTETTEAEKTAAFLATRLAGGLKTLSGFKDTGPEVDATIAGWFGDTARNAFNSEDRQRIEAAQLDILDAALTLGTGAAYTKEQLEGYRRAYFPQLFDDDNTIADKRGRLGLLLEAARVKSGAASPQIDKALSAAGFAAANDRDDEPAGPVVLPRAAGSHEQGGSDVDGVTPKGEGFRPEPKLYHLGNTVAGMIAGGKDVGEIRQYLDEQYAPYGVGTSTPMMAKINEVIQAHKANPSKPIKTLVPGWDNLHMVPDNAEPTIVGQIADSPAGAFGLGVADIGTMGFGDEIAGAIGGDELNAAWDYSRQERPGAYMTGQLAGSLLLPTGAPGAGRAAGTSALRAGEGMTAARIAASKAAAQRIGLEGAAYGTVHGAGSADGDLADRATGALTEGALGYAGGRLGGAVAGRVANRARPVAGAAIDEGIAGASDPAAYAAAAERQGVVPFAGDMDTRVAAASGKLAQTQAGVGPVTRAAQKTLASAQAARDRIAKSIGNPAEGEGLGYRISEEAKKAVAREHDRAQSLYKSAERQSEGVRVRPTESFQVISDEIDKIADTGLGDKALNIFRRLQDRMTQGPMSVETLRNIRTQIREDLATEGLRGGKANAAAQRIMEAITRDVDGTLRANGLSDAADLFQQADGVWAAYTELTDDVVSPLIGKNGEFSGEQVVKRLQADLRGNNARAAHLLRALPAEGQSLARASVIQSLGHATKGQQNAANDAFSLSTFLTHWNEIGDTAKEAYFGSQARAALNDLAKVAEGAKQSQRWANHSNSGGALNAPVETGAALLTFGGSALATNVTARMLTSQRMVRWLAAAAKKPNSKALEAHVKRLSGLAEAEPALANEILNLQQRLMDSFVRSPAPVYADDKGNRGVEPPQQGAADDRP